ncbi:sporulation-specific diadenylate cyclase CdaS [Bacillus tuaregi]|uniref:sporulation-specific diadenylate cyclase CdaS n=1 Tax=Bacillus tuaregi TaxID=1816695 RepID=UPI0008F93A08|nr:sporulation-specific diadenylate cyclase CdaS [Bacillus tuaregi]
MEQKEQYMENLHRYMGHIESHINKVKAIMHEHDCCILTDLDQMQKLVSEAQNLAAVYYLQSYLAPYTKQYINLSLAVQHLSEKRHGALIAVERNAPLEPFIHNGTLIEADISHLLLETVFYPGNPLHDGGVVIRDGTIYSAGNIFPLTDTTYQHRKLGTRHRAAIGLSEQTDAVIIVVSEETGRISFAIDGQLFIVRASV